MAEIIWLKQARNDVDQIVAYIEMFDPSAALGIAADLDSLANSLTDFPRRGSPAARGTREMVTVHPYILRYRVVGQKVYVLRVRHSARRPLR